MRRMMEERLEGGLRGGMMIPSYCCCSFTTGAMLKSFRDAHCPLTAPGLGMAKNSKFIFPIW